MGWFREFDLQLLSEIWLELRAPCFLYPWTVCCNLSQLFLTQCTQYGSYLSNRETRVSPNFSHCQVSHLIEHQPSIRGLPCLSTLKPKFCWTSTCELYIPEGKLPLGFPGSGVWKQFMTNIAWIIFFIKKNQTNAPEMDYP